MGPNAAQLQEQLKRIEERAERMLAALEAYLNG